MMKTRSAIIYVLTMQCLAALTGCDVGDTPQDAKAIGAKGTVRVFVGIDAENPAQPNVRTVVPRNPDFTYTLTFSADEKPAITATLEGNTSEVLLDEGTWTLSVIGEKNGETVAEADPLSVMVSVMAPATVAVTMRPTLDGAEGTFSYAITTDEAISGVSATLTPRDVGNAAQTSLSLGEARSVSLAPGYYRLMVVAMKGTQPLIRRELVHIYSHTETFTSYALTEADFAPVIRLGGTLTGGFDGYGPSAVIVYEDAECQTPIDESAVTNDGAWSVAVEDTLETVYFKIQLEKDMDNEGHDSDAVTGFPANGKTDIVYYSKPTAVTGFPTSGKADIALPITGYTITFDANGGVFEGGEARITLTAPENGTLTLPSVSRGNSEFVGWYNESGDFTAETRITGDAAFYADWIVGLDGLADAPGGDTADNPVALLVNRELTNEGWAAILSEIDAVGKYVALDLSACAMTDTAFDPGIPAGADKVTALVLPDAARSIRAGTSRNPTFNAFTSLVSISGAGVETVGDYAFNDCPNLTEVSLPAATDIGSDAFRGCTNLMEVSLPVAQTIGYDAFCGTRLTSVSLPAATDINAGAFSGTRLTSVDLPAAEIIDSNAFTGCTSLTEVSLPAATFVGYMAFSGCASLRTVSLPAVEIISDTAFDSCTSLTEVSLPAAEIISESAFSNCTNLREVNLPAVTNIGSVAFLGCTNLTEVSLPSAVTIGAAAFYNCNNLTSVSLPIATDIGDSAFNGCPSLMTVSLPVAQTIGGSTFYGCTSLTEVSLPASPPAISTGYYGGIFSDTGSRGIITISVPTGEVSAYTSAWGVDADTSAGGNTSVYGENHKAISITDTAQ
jgi:hypothetical protein